jgi:enoyl-CoA hydratase/carnithine racemase
MRMSDHVYRDISFTREEGVAVLTLARPEARNTFTGAMGEDLAHAYRRCDEDDAIRAVVLTGAGDAFCAGAEMSADIFASPEAKNSSAAGVAFPAFRVRKPVIAAVNGHAIGIGFTLAIQADIRFFAAEGKYGVLQVRRGMMPDGYSHFTLPRLIGVAKAADVLLTGRRFDGVEAERLGIATRVLPAGEVLPAALELAHELAVEAAPLSMAVTKRLLWESFALSAAEVEQKETALHHHLMGKPDAVEGPTAWMERRKPQWELQVSRDWPTWPGKDENE